MEQHLALIVSIEPSAESESLMAFLAEAGFEGFEELPDRLIAYRPVDTWDPAEINAFLTNQRLTFSYDTLQKTNWNHLWESNFEPVLVDDFVGLRAHFHAPIPGVKLELVITPKMSFGTGHHATTRLMIQAMRHRVASGSTVLDFGTGTGVLAILAKKMGADRVVGIDIEDWSVENARENARENQVADVAFICADRITESGPFDLILANINRNILLDHLAALRDRLAPRGTLILSGIVEEDLPVMDQAIEQQGLKRIECTGERGWVCLQIVHNQ